MCVNNVLDGERTGLIPLFVEYILYSTFQYGRIQVAYTLYIYSVYMRDRPGAYARIAIAIDLSSFLVVLGCTYRDHQVRSSYSSFIFEALILIIGAAPCTSSRTHVLRSD